MTSSKRKSGASTARSDCRSCAVLGRPSIDLYYLGYDRQNGAFDQTARIGSPAALPGHETRHSFGGRLHGTVFPLGGGPFTGEFHYDVEGIYQFGRFGDTSISAYEASFDVGYYFKELPFGPNVSLRYDMTRGDGNLRDGRLETFTPLFPKGIYFSEPGLIGPSDLIALHPVVDWHLCKNVGLITTVIGYWRQDTGDGVYNFGGAPSLPGASMPAAAGGGTVPSGSRYVGTEGERLVGMGHQPPFDLRSVLLPFFCLCLHARRRDGESSARWPQWPEL
jgi:hypothetical protein